MILKSQNISAGCNILHDTFWLFRSPLLLHQYTYVSAHYNNKTTTPSELHVHCSIVASLIHSCLGRWNLIKLLQKKKKTNSSDNKSGTQTTSLAIIAIKGLSKFAAAQTLAYLLACLFVSRRVSASASTKISVGVNKGCISKAIRS